MKKKINKNKTMEFLKIKMNFKITINNVLKVKKVKGKQKNKNAVLF